MNIKTIVFDLGGVLIDWNPRYLFSKVFDSSEKMEFFLNEVCNQDWNEQQDAGRSFAEGTSLLKEKFPEYSAEIEVYDSRWHEMLGGAIESTVEILESFHKTRNYRLLALTNWSSEKFPIARERYDFLNYFEGILVSGDDKLKKPDPAIYNLLCNRYDLLPEEALFIDDSLKNIKAAKELGFLTHHFQNPAALHNFLKKQELL